MRDIAVLAAAFAFLPGCDRTRLKPIDDPTRGSLTCDCQAPEPGLQVSVISFEVGQVNGAVGQRLWGLDANGNCSIITLTGADVGREIFECSPHRNNYNIDNDGFREMDIAGWPEICNEPNKVPRCVPLVEGTTEQIELTSGTPATADEKCNIICRENRIDTAVQLCDAIDVKDCRRWPEITIHRHCAKNLTATLVPLICTPENSTDPVGVVVEIDPAMSFVHTADADGGAAEPAVSGFFVLSTDECSSGTCAVSLVRSHMRIADFTLASERVTNAAVGNATPIPGSLFPSGVFTIGGVGVDISAIGRISSEARTREGPAALGGPMVGVFRPDGGISLDITLTSVDGLSLEATLVGRSKNRRPRVSFSLADRLECTTAAGAVVSLAADASADLDGDIEVLKWYVDGNFNATGQRAQILVPFGAHAVTLFAQDRLGATRRVAHSTFVADTTAPMVTALDYLGPVCVWPPNHEYAVLDIDRDFRSVVTDACDPAPVLRFASVSSNQPDDGLGDGTTSADAVINAAHACLRAERAGIDPSGRVYELSLVATDRAGNSSDPSFHIRVPHDQSAGTCVRRVRVEGADTPDICATNSNGRPDDILPSGDKTGGCSTTDATLTSGLLLLLVWVLQGRRRSL